MVSKWVQDPGTLGPGTRDPPQSLEVGPETPLKFKIGTPSPFFDEFIFFGIFLRFFYLFIFAFFLNKINCEWQKSIVNTKDKQVHVATKNYPKKLNRTLVNPIAQQSFLKCIRKGLWPYSSCHEKHPMDVHGWVFTLYLRFCVWPLSGKNILFFTFNRSVSNAQFFLVKYMLAMVPNLKKTYTFAY